MIPLALLFGAGCSAATDATTTTTRPAHYDPSTTPQNPNGWTHDEIGLAYEIFKDELGEGDFTDCVTDYVVDHYTVDEVARMADADEDAAAHDAAVACADWVGETS